MCSATSFFYIVYFQEPGVADAELGGDPARTMRRLLTSVRIRRAVPPIRPCFANDGRGFVDRIPEPDGLADWLGEDELDHYIDEFTRTGFTGGLNWYRNLDRNWTLTERIAGAKIDGAVAVHRRRARPGAGDDAARELRRSARRPSRQRARRRRGPLGAAGEAERGQRRAHRVHRRRPRRQELTMRAAVLRGGAMVVRDDVRRPATRVRSSARAGQGVRHLRLRPALRQARRHRCWRSAPRWRACPTSAARPPDLGRDVFMGHEFSAEVLDVGPDTVAPEAGHARHVDPGHAHDDRRPGPRVQQRPTRRLQRTDAAVGADARSRCRTGSTPTGPRSPSRWRSGCTRSTESGIEAGDGRARARLWSGRASRSSPGSKLRGIEPIVASDFSPARRALARAHGRARGRRSRARKPRSTRGHARAAAVRWWCSKRSVCPASSTSALRVGAAAEPHRHRRRVHGARHDHAVLRHRQGAQPSVRARLRPDGVRRQPARRSRRARSTSSR